ncbi:transposon Ty3-I Gag-Pol polyprotein [Trichonephila clavipes]|nr:transposon Ty3-I Gag-Pol polyprotein [Trichonephila clavipes]
MIFLQTLWLQRLPANLQQVLSVCKAPLDELTQIADKVHEVSGSDLTVARIETKSNQIELDVLKAEIADLKNMRLTKFSVKQDLELYAANGSRISTYGIIELELDFGLRRSFPWSFLVADVSDPIIGADFLQRFELLIDIRNRRLLDGLTSLFVRGTVKQVQSLGLTLVEVNSHLTIPYYQNIQNGFPQISNPVLMKAQFFIALRLKVRQFMLELDALILRSWLI